MIVKINEKDFLRSVASNKHKALFDDVTSFINAVYNEGHLSENVIKRFRSEKLTSTDSIFKFRLSDGYRCLYRYEKNNRLFENENELILLKVVNHDDQGKEGRRLDKTDKNESHFEIVNHVDAYESRAHEDFVNNEKYYRYIPVNQNISTEALMHKLSEADNQFLYPLQCNQNEVIDYHEPVLLMGSAGSGKTLVEISKVIKNAHTPSRQLYVTFTQMLKEHAKELYDRYSAIDGIQGDVEFETFAGFGLGMLNLSKNQYFSLEAYLQWFKEEGFAHKYPWMKKMDPVDLWTEIRGIIKGYCNDYYRNHLIRNLDKYIEKSELKMFIAQGVIKKVGQSNSYFQITNMHEFLSMVKEPYPQVIDMLKTKDYQEPLIDQYTYLKGMSNKYSIFDEDQRKSIYDFVVNVYQPYLSEQGLFDDNDLARNFRYKNFDNGILPYDYVLIDETQDLSELQILSLIELADDVTNTFMTGDVSQIINPTLFIKGRVGALYNQRFGIDSLNSDIVLNKNFRNGQRILNIVHKLLELRQSLLGKHSNDIKEISKAEEKNAGTPFSVNTDESKILDILKTWIGVPNVAVIVSDLNAKKRLKSEIEVNDSETNIYTVQEIKGREFQKTLLYNITSDYADVFNYLWENPKPKDKAVVTKYMYYFNLFYVAMTRAKYNVFLFEQNKSNVINEIEPLFEPLDSNINSVMDIARYDTYENRRLQAHRHFKEGDFERAKTYFLQIDDEENASISNAYALFQKGKHEEGLLEIYPYEKHYAYALNFSNANELFKQLLMYKLNKRDVDECVHTKNLMKKLEKYEKTSIYPMLLKDTINLITRNYSHKINKQINAMKEGEE